MDVRWLTMRSLVLLAIMPLGACATMVQLPADPRASLEPLSFFSGASRGRGTFRQILSAPRDLRVESVGRRAPGGGLVLTQVIRLEGKQPRTRRWTMRQVGPGRYIGELTEAVGPVSITVAGPRATIRYRMDGGLEVRQQLALQADGRTLLNHLEVRKWGVRVAHVEETIRKLH